MCISANAAPNCHFYVEGENYICDLINFNADTPLLNHIIGFTNADVTIVRPSFPLNPFEVLSSSIMNEFPNLRELHLTNLGINSINSDAFESCNELEVLKITGGSLKEIPLNLLQNCQKLKVFSLYSNNLTEVPFNTLAQLPALEVLDLSFNHFAAIPQDFPNLPKLKSLTMMKSDIRTISPTAFDQLDQLEELIIDGNQLVTFEANLPQLKNLQLRNNFMTHVTFTNFTNLEVLDMTDNELRNFTAFSNEIKDCKKLSVLNLSDNWLTVVSFHHDSLQHLDLDLNDIQNVEVEDFSLKNLTFLSMRANGMTKVSLPKLESLQTLNLDSNQLTKLNSLAMIAPYLKHLSVSHNKLTDIIDGDVNRHFVSFNKLEKINLAANMLKKLKTDDFRLMKSLTYLDLSLNFVEELPRGIFKYFEDIVGIDVSHNNLKVINRSAFGYHKKLESIRLEFNSINAVDPAMLEDFPNLRDFSMSGNPCVNPSVTLMARLQKCLINYEEASRSTTTTTVSYEKEQPSSKKDLLMSLIGILAVAGLLFALIYYIHDMLLIKEKRDAIKKGVIKVDDKTLPDYQRF